MNKAVRRRAVSGVALLGASAIVVIPIPPPTPPAIHVANLESRLAASVANIPLNLVYALANVPYNGVQAVDQVAASLFHGGNWLVRSATNVWGTDAGDPGKWESLANLLVPFPAMSHILGKQLAMIAAAELPVSDSCDAETCYPVTPIEPITGISVLDQGLQMAAILLGFKSLGLIDNWFPRSGCCGGRWLRVPLSELISGYTFPRVVSVSGPAYDGFGYQGTHPDPVTGEPLMAWSGTAFTWNPLEPLVAFYDSLTAPLAPPGDAINVVTPKQVIRAFQALLAGIVVAFDPLVPGSPYCAAKCEAYRQTVPTVVKFIGDLYPGNRLIDEWLIGVKNGTVNGPTDAQITQSISDLQPGIFTFDRATTAKINAWLADIDPVMPDIAAHIGLLSTPDLVALLADIGRLVGNGGSSDTESIGSPDAARLPLPAAMRGVSTTRAAQRGSAMSISPLAPDFETPNAKTVPVAPSGQAVDNVSTEAQQDIRAITPAPLIAGQTPDSESKPDEESDQTTSRSVHLTPTEATRGHRTTPQPAGGLSGDGTASTGDTAAGGTSSGDSAAGKVGGRHRAT